MDNFDLKKYLAEGRLLKETKEEDYYNLLMDLGGTELAGDTFEDMMYKRGEYVSFEDFLDDELDFFQKEGDVEVINKIKSTFLNENKLLKEVRGPIEKIELHIKKGESVDDLDQYGFETNVDDEPIEDLFDENGLALRDMSIIYDQRGDMYLMDTEDITKYH